MTKKQNRREFLGAAGVVATGALAANAKSADVDPTDDPSSYFQPKEYWEDRIKAPDDGKKSTARSTGGLLTPVVALAVTVAKWLANPRTMYRWVISSGRRSSKTSASIPRSLACSYRWRANIAKTRLALRLVLAGHWESKPAVA